MNKYLIVACCFLQLQLHAQSKRISFLHHINTSRIDIGVDGKYFSSFVFSDSLEKPVLFPIHAANDAVITRGFPLNPREDERIDHPHQAGLWFTYEDVNGIDFWNNSYAIPAERKSRYGWIRSVQVTQMKEGKKEGRLSYTANWERQDRRILLAEHTSFIFSGTDKSRTIERITTLTARNDTVRFKDVKDGLLGIRVASELEMPSDEVMEMTSERGSLTIASPDPAVTSGSYLNSIGKAGDEVWGTRANWCRLTGTKDGSAVSITIMDHPKNPGYPGYWHARGYGLFAQNPLGQHIFSNGKETMNLILAPGKSVTFRYRILINNTKIPGAVELNKLTDEFATTNNHPYD